jgi:signal transduction histidine kinase
VPRYTPEGVFLGYIGVCIDITEQKDAEAALQERESDLKALTESLEQRVIKRTAELTRTIQDLDQFAYVASHDLKTPLRAIDSLASWIAEDAGDLLPEASQEHLRKLRGRVKRLEGLLNDLLAYSRAGREHEERQQINTRKLVNYIAQMIEPPPEFEIIAAPDLPILLTNRVPLETVLRNLISNAINHHHRDQGKVFVSAREAGDWVEFRVEDDGPGIAPIFHERIFGMFQTLRPRDEGEGSGMGLALVKKIVENFGGKVGIISTEGDGSIFWFTWPK